MISNAKYRKNLDRIKPLLKGKLTNKQFWELKNMLREVIEFEKKLYPITEFEKFEIKEMRKSC